MTERILPDAFLAEYGNPWRGDPFELEDEYSVAHLADGMRRQLEALFDKEVVRSKAPALKVHVVVLPLGEPKCNVWYLRSKPNEYVVALNIGMFERFNELLSDEQLWQLVFPKLQHLRYLKKEYFFRLVKFLAIYNVAAHEFAHIVRGHLRLIDAVPRDRIEEKTEYRKLCEADADKWGSYILAGEIATQSRSISQDVYKSAEAANGIAYELLSVLTVTLYRCFSIYNQHGVAQSSFYPHPLLRALSISIGVADNFTKANSASETKQRLVSVLTGMELAEEFAASSGELPQKSWDIGHEVIGFQQNIATKLDALTVALAPYSPSNLPPSH